MSDKQSFSAEDSSSIRAHPGFSTWERSLQKNYPQASGSELDFSKFESKLENTTCIGNQLPSRTDTRNVAKTVSEYSATERTADRHSVNEHSGIGTDADRHSVSVDSSVGRDVDIYSVSEDQSDKNLEAIAYQILKISGENSPGEYNSDVITYLSLNDISLEYWQLYFETLPENFDFAMNIMAYIELLNDTSWITTISYLDENIKKVVKDIWYQKKDGINNLVEMQNDQIQFILKMMVDFTQWSLNRKYDLGEFLNYCVIMCQIGVASRKRGFKKAPLYAIRQLRDRIKLLNFEDIMQILFEIVVKEYSQKLVEYSRV